MSNSQAVALADNFTEMVTLFSINEVYVNNFT